MFKIFKEERGNTVLIVVVVVSILLLVGGLFLLASTGKKKISSDEALALLRNDQSYFKGGKDATVEIVEFSDLQCPACQASQPAFNQIIQEYGDKIKFTYRHYPLTRVHKNAYAASLAAEAAGAQNKFWELHDMLFEKQSDWETLEGQALADKFFSYASEIQVSDIEKFKSEYNNKTYANRIDKDIDDGNKLGVDSTPTVFLNGERVSNWSYTEMKKLIDAKLAQ